MSDAGAVFKDMLEDNEKLLKKYMDFQRAIAQRSGAQAKLSGTPWWQHLCETTDALRDFSNSLKAEIDKDEVISAYLEARPRERA